MAAATHPPTPPPNPTFVVTFDTPPASFKVDKGGTATINATLEVKWDTIKKVRFSTHANYTGLEISPSSATITPGSPLKITVTATSLLSFCSPSFVVDAVGLNAQNRPEGPQPGTTTYRWTAGNCP